VAQPLQCAGVKAWVTAFGQAALEYIGVIGGEGVQVMKPHGIEPQAAQCGGHIHGFASGGKARITPQIDAEQSDTLVVRCTSQTVKANSNKVASGHGQCMRRCDRFVQAALVGSP